MVERGYLDGTCEADVKFHETIIKGARNTNLPTCYQSVTFRCSIRNWARQVHMEDYELTDQEHRSVVAAIRRNDLEAALQTPVKHLIRVEVTSFEDDVLV